MNILIVTGGSSSERKISLISAQTVKEALLANGHKVTIFDFKKGLVALKATLKPFDVVFPVMHGKEGEDGTLYRFLRKAKRRHVGANPKGANIATDKILFKTYCDKKKIRTAEWKVVKNARDIQAFGFPCVLKAANGGSSHEVVPLFSKTDLAKPLVKKILKLNDRFFVERFVTGTEITVGVLGKKALPVLEIVPPKGGWFDYRNKYSGGTKEIPFAPSVPKKIQLQAQRIALRIHNDLKLGPFSRTDLIIQDEMPYVLEINTPGGVGLTPQSLFPRAVKAVGMEYKEMVEKIVNTSL